MRSIPNIRIERYRMPHPVLGESTPGENWGYFEVRRSPGILRIIASDGMCEEEMGWEHVSVSLADRKPTWDEMQLVKELFWHEEETVIQFHPAASQYVNLHPNVLHLWKRRGIEIELPPTRLIAPSRSPPDKVLE